MYVLHATQHTNIILIDVPLRYDVGKRPYVNKEIMNYNKKLRKVTKKLKNAQLVNPLNAELIPICHFLALFGAHHILHISRIRVKATTDRELFNRHRLHLNKRGKEIMISEIIEKLLTNVDSQKVNVIHLPWKIESAKQIANEQSVSTTEVNDRVVTSVKKNVKIKEILSADIHMEGSKETSRSSSKKDVETKMVLSTDIQLEGSKQTETK